MVEKGAPHFYATMRRSAETYFLSFSHGSRLFSTYAHSFPNGFRAVDLDGILDMLSPNVRIQTAAHGKTPKRSSCVLVIDPGLPPPS